MSFIKLNLGPTEVVLGTVTKKHLRISLGSGAVRALGWSEGEPNLTVALGDGEDAGWLRIFIDEEGSTPEEIDGRVELSVPRSAVPDLEACKSSPLTWRVRDGAIDVRLPTIAPVAGKDRLREVPKGTGHRPVGPDDRPEVVGPPALYGQLHRDAWAAGIEVHFLSDGNCVVNGKVFDVDEVESAVRRAGEKRSSDVSRSTAA